MQIPMREPGRIPVGAGLAGVGPGAARRVKEARIKLVTRARQVRMAWRLILIGVLICSAAIIWLHQTSQIVSLGYENENITAKEALLDRQAEAINTEIGKLTNLRQIDEAARKKLGMTEATKFIYVEIPASSSSAVNGDSINPRLYQVTDWWRIVSQMLPSPWRDQLPSRPK